jgi:hypothetical protein
MCDLTKFDLNKWRKNVAKDLTEEERLAAFDQFVRLMLLKCGINPYVYYSMAAMAYELVRRHVDGVLEFRGPLACFIRECRQDPLLGAPSYPLEVTGKLIQVDQNGSYAATYANFDGIPVGIPAMIKDWEEAKRSEGHYYVRIELKSFKCKHCGDPYPMIEKLGTQFWDKYWFEAVEQHYDIKYEFVCGYQFRNGYASIKGITEELWALREKCRGQPEEKFLKRVMNMWWGRSIRKNKKETKVEMKPKLVQSFMDRHPLVVSHREEGEKAIVATARPLSAAWQIPQFGVNVSSWSRVQMQEKIWDIIDQGGSVYYCNTDSLVIDQAFKELIPIGSQLGEFKVEIEMARFICLAPKTMCWLKMGHKFGRDDLAWWEEQLKKGQSPAT